MWTAHAVWCGSIPMATGLDWGLFPGSALADPAERRLGPFGGRLMLAVAPGTAGAFLVMVLPARDADHDPLCVHVCL